MGTRAAKLALFHRHEPLVRRMASGFMKTLPRNVLRDDVLAAGMSGLWDAVNRRDKYSDESFEWYVRVRVRGAILDELRAQDWLPRRARARADEATASGNSSPLPTVVRLDDVSLYEMDRALAVESSAEVETFSRERAAQLATLVSELPPRERFIVDRHYCHGVKFKDLGTELGVSEPRISQIHKVAIERMRSALNTRALAL